MSNVQKSLSERSQKDLRLQNRDDLQVPRPRLEITRTSFSYKRTKVWNDIPNNVRNVKSAAPFKNQVRNYFLDQYDVKDPLKHDLLEEQYDLRYLFCLFHFCCYKIILTDGVSCIKKNEMK